MQSLGFLEAALLQVELGQTIDGRKRVRVVATQDLLSGL